MCGVRNSQTCAKCQLDKMAGGKNCGKCFKCKRTLVCLDALGKLDEFADVFDIGYYREHRSDYLKWLILQSFNRKGEEWCMISSAYDVIVSRGGLSLANRVGAVLMWLKSRLRKYKTLRSFYGRCRVMLRMN